jgi:ribosome-binding factor A
VGKNITARLTPSLEFILDALPENAASIDRLLQEARQRDHESQAMASSAEYAGDADPYVKPRDLDADDELDGDDDLEDDLALDDELEAPAVGESTEPDGATR